MKTKKSKHTKKSNVRLRDLKPATDTKGGQVSVRGWDPHKKEAFVGKDQ
jgi:hypothetical protein